MDVKKKIEEQYAEAMQLIEKLKSEGKAEDEIRTIVGSKGYLAPVLSKLFRASGRKLTGVASREDKELAGATIEERKDARRSIREKEIEDAAWVHRANVNAPQRVLGLHF